MSQVNDFNDFLKFSNSQKEVSLMIAKDEEQLSEYRQKLDLSYYKQASELSHLLSNIDSPRKMYLVVKDELSKDLYDFILQYPTGQIEIFDKEKRKPVVAHPSYRDVSLVILLTKKTLDDAQRKDFSILENVGLAYQS